MSKITTANQYVAEAGQFVSQLIALSGVIAPPVAIVITAVKAFVHYLRHRDDPDGPEPTTEELDAFAARVLELDDVYIARLKAQAGESEAQG